jgi:FG-GAP repeat
MIFADMNSWPRLSPTVAGVGDFNGDGRPDVLYDQALSEQ